MRRWPVPTLEAPIRNLGHQHRGPHLLVDIVRTYQVVMAAFSRRVGVPTSRLAVMRLLIHGGQGVGIMELAKQLGIHPAAVTRQVQDLERDGLAQRSEDARDGRRSYVKLSAKGKKAFEGIHDRSQELEQLLSKVISDDEARQAGAVLKKLREFIEKG